MTLTNASFEGSLHTSLWRVCADGITNGKLACFTSNYTSNGNQLGIAYANERGYTPCPAYFKDTITHQRAKEILSELNEIIFGLDEKASFRIVISSMATNTIPA